MEIILVNKKYLAKQRKEFKETLNKAAEKVKTWPKWKQDIKLGLFIT
jgi:hypothetical protein